MRIKIYRTYPNQLDPIIAAHEDFAAVMSVKITLANGAVLCPDIVFGDLIYILLEAAQRGKRQLTAGLKLL